MFLLNKVLKNGSNLKKFIYSILFVKEEIIAEDNSFNYNLTNIEEDYKNFPLYNKDDIKFILGRKWLSILKRIYVFDEMVKYCISNNPFCEYKFSTCNQKLLIWFGSSCNISKLIRFLTEIGLLIVSNPHFHFNPENKNENICRKYFFNKKQALELRKIFKELGFDEETKKEILSKSILFRKGNIKVKGNCMIKDCYAKQTVLDKRKYNEEEIERSFWKCNENAVEASLDLDDMILNEYFKYDFLWERMNLHLKETDKSWTGISMRGYSELCSTKNDLKTGYEYKEGDKRRSEYLKRYFGDREWWEYDVNASIYRISNFLTKGEWSFDNKDFYEYLSGRKFENKADRNSFKEMSMRLYFSNSPKQMINQLCFDNEFFVKIFRESEIKDYLISETKKEFYSLRDKIGVSFGADIFVHESCIYVSLLKKILKRGYKCCHVYDCFYIDERLDKEKFEKMLKETLEEYRSKYKRLIDKRIKSLHKKETNKKSYKEDLNRKECLQPFLDEEMEKIINRINNEVLEEAKEKCERIKNGKAIHKII